MKAIHQLSTFKNILESYQNEEPLHRFLATYYRHNKQMGSRDRKIASRLIYNYFRLGNAIVDESSENRLIVAEFMCNHQPNSFLEHYYPLWNNAVHFSINEKYSYIKDKYPNFELEDVFPYNQYISPEIDKDSFFTSFFVQPDLFIRAKRGAEKKIAQLLSNAEINYKIENNHTFALPNGTKLDQIISYSGSYEVQDLSSQSVGEFFKPNKWDKWWDCCAASGGKSLLLHDQQPDIKLLVSDNRASILDNLQQRFALAGIKNYQKKELDLLQSQDQTLHDYEFDGIIFDAPCSGSGTWSRTPEMIQQFAVHKIKFYSELQQKIAKNIMKYLKIGKPLIYITCSVFKQENEDQVNWLCNTFDLELESQQLFKGYLKKADTLFVARLIKKSQKSDRETID